MPIKGYFRTGFHPLPAPFVQAHIHFPRLDVDGFVDFLIDTGADVTSIHPRDSIPIGVSFRRLRRSTAQNASGIGGSIKYFKEYAVITFADETGYQYTFFGDVSISQKSTLDVSMPSLLGRDVLNTCSLYIDKRTNEVSISPSLVDVPPEASSIQLPLGGTTSQS